MLSKIKRFDTSEYSELTKEEKKDYVLDYVLEVTAKLTRLPEQSELTFLSLTRSVIRENWVALGNLYRHPDFEKMGIVTWNDFSELKMAKTRKEIKKHNRFLITTVESNRKIPKERLQAIQSYCKKRNALLLVFVMGKDKLMMDPEMKKHHLILETINLTNTLSLLPISNSSPQPLSDSIAHYTKNSFIVPHYKLSKSPIPTGPNKIPRLAMSTGTISGNEPLYTEKGDGLVKSEFVKDISHEISMYVIETSGEFFFERPIMFDTDHSFIDLTKDGFVRYLPNGKTKSETPEWHHLGDWHSGETSMQAKRNNHLLAKITKPKFIIFNDLHSHLGPSHHNDKDPIYQYHLSRTPLIHPSAEFKILANDMKEWHDIKELKNTKFVVVESNHDDHLAKAVKQGIMEKHPGLLKARTELTLALINGERLTEWGLKEYAGFESKRIQYLSRNEEFSVKSKVGKLYGHLHGDLGNRGSKNSTSSTSGLSLSSGCAVVGHTHESRIIPGISSCGLGNGGVWYSGTSTCVYGPDMPHYAKDSANAWLITSTIVFQGKGRILRTQITVIGGQIGIDFGKPQNIADTSTYTESLKKTRLIKKAK
jgi:hypothetical protein